MHVIIIFRTGVHRCVSYEATIRDCKPSHPGSGSTLCYQERTRSPMSHTHTLEHTPPLREAIFRESNWEQSLADEDVDILIKIVASSTLRTIACQKKIDTLHY